MVHRYIIRFPVYYFGSFRILLLKICNTRKLHFAQRSSNNKLFALKQILIIFMHLKWNLPRFMQPNNETYTCTCVLWWYVICAFYSYISLKRTKSYYVFIFHMLVRIIEKLHCLLPDALYLCSLRRLDNGCHF